MNNDTLRSTHISLYDFFYQVMLVVYVNVPENMDNTDNTYI